MPAAASKVYVVQRPVAAFLCGAAVALLAGLIGLGGAEFRLPLLILVFALFPHRAIRINLLISLATLAAAAVVRLRYVEQTAVTAHVPEIVAMSLAGVGAAWLGAGQLARIPKGRIAPLIAALLVGIAVLLVDPAWRILVGAIAGVAVGAISSLLGVAGGEFIIPILMFIFGADIRTAGTASVLISLPIVLAGVIRHLRTGHFRSRSMLAWLVLPMSLGSIVGALAGGVLSAAAPTQGLRVALAAILAISAYKLWKDAGRGRFG